jgi:Domain of unknown function (DUF4430)
VKRLAVLAFAVVVAGCGGGGGGRAQGTATLWVTRDRGAKVVYTGTVPAGLTAMQALDRRLDIKTRYGGRFVQSISGIEGSATRQRDWFWYVNGIEGDRSAAEYKLRPGDIEWWDYRSWRGQMSVPVVVGAFPEPFLHGFDGKVGDVYVSGPRAIARRIANVVNGSLCCPKTAKYAVVIDPRAGRFHARKDGSVVKFWITPRDALRLAKDPRLARFRYEGLG